MKCDHAVQLCTCCICGCTVHISVPRGTYFEQGATAQVLSLHNCGFRYDYPSAVNETFVTEKFSQSWCSHHWTSHFSDLLLRVWASFAHTFTHTFFLGTLCLAPARRDHDRFPSENVHFLHWSDYSVWFDACLEHLPSAVC